MPLEHRLGGNWMALVFGILFLLGGIGGMVGAWGAYITDINIERHGQRVETHLLKKVFMDVVDGSSDYILEYNFMPEGGTIIEARCKVSKELWNSLHEGQLIEVRYALNNPKRNFPAGAGVRSLGVTVFVSVLSLLFGLFGSALVWSYARSSQTDA